MTTFYAYADYNKQRPAVGRHARRRVFRLGQGLWHQRRDFPSRRRQRYGRLLRLAGQRHLLCLRGYKAAASSRRACTAATAAAIPTRPTVSAPTSHTRPTAAAIRPNSSIRRATTRSMPTRITTRAASIWRACYGSYGSGYSNSASGFATNVALLDQRRQRYGRILRLAGQRHVLCLRGLQQQRPALAGMYGSYGGGYSNSASGFGTNVAILDQRRQRYGRILRLAGQRHVLCLRELQQERPDVGRHVRQLRRRLFQFGQRLRHHGRNFEQRRQRYGEPVRLARQ